MISSIVFQENKHRIDYVSHSEYDVNQDAIVCGQNNCNIFNSCIKANELYLRRKRTLIKMYKFCLALFQGFQSILVSRPYEKCLATEVYFPHFQKALATFNNKYIYIYI